MNGLKRVIISGREKFFRDRSSTGAALVVMIVVLFMVSSLFFVRGVSAFIIDRLEEAVDVSVYFSDSVPEAEILQAQDEFRGMPEIKSVAYVSKEKAYEAFVGRHRRDEVILQSLNELGQNPLLPSLDIKARDPDQYILITRNIEESAFGPSIQSIDFYDRESVIERLSGVSRGIRLGAFGASAILGIIAVLVAFNTIRLTIYASREEIEIMRLVGAANWHIRGPFVVQGVIVGVISALTALAITFGLALLLSSRMESALSGFSMLEYFASNVFALALTHLLVGIGLGTVSSMIAIRRHLKV